MSDHRSDHSTAWSQSSTSESHSYRSVRPDGSLRPAERPVRPGYQERTAYVPPARRREPVQQQQVKRASDAAEPEAAAEIENCASGNETVKVIVNEEAETETVPVSEESSFNTAVADDEYSWAEEESPVVKSFVAAGNSVSSVSVSSSSSSSEASRTATAIAAPEQEPASAIKREPSKLATAIDDALDNLSLGSASSGSERQIGRFAAQIRDEQERVENTGRPSQYCQRRAATYGHGQQRPSHDHHHHHHRSRYHHHQHDSGSRPSNDDSSNVNTTRIAINNSSDNNNNSSNSNNVNAPGASQCSVSHCQSNCECSKLRTCLESLSKYRREMALINAKLEYIRYMCAAKDEEDMSPVELERVGQEEALLARLDEIYVLIEGLD